MFPRVDVCRGMMSTAAFFNDDNFAIRWSAASGERAVRRKVVTGSGSARRVSREMIGSGSEGMMIGGSAMWSMRDIVAGAVHAREESLERLCGGVGRRS